MRLDSDKLGRLVLSVFVYDFHLVLFLIFSHGAWLSITCQMPLVDSPENV
jgi:hypothetical protein